MRLPALRATLRIARRDALRAPARSILVVAMIALPILALTSADILARTAELSPAEEVTKQMGSADAVVAYDSFAARQNNDAPKPKTTADVLRDLPAGSQVVPRSTVRAALRTKHGVKLAEFSGFDYLAPSVRGLIRQLSGRAPRTGNEVALSQPLARAIGLSIGDSLRTTWPKEKTFQVVGIVEDPYILELESAYTVPSGLPATHTSDRSGGYWSQQWYATTISPVYWHQVVALSRKGYAVTSREVLLRPPPEQPKPQSVNAETVATIVLAVGMALLEVVLLAGPAFAVGARRRRRELALVSATGGDQRDVRNVVLAGGAVLGLTAGVLGVALGIGLAAVLRPVLERLSGSVTGHFDVRPAELAGVALLGVITGLAAAYLPARAAARQDVTTALAGRRGIVRTRAHVPLIGLGLALVGTVIAIGGGVLFRMPVLVLAGAVVAEAGLIVCTPALLGLAGRLGRRLPPSPRMALRDAARNRSAAAPAVAAVMAAVAGSVGIGIFVASLSARDRAAYEPGLPQGDAAVLLESSTATDVAPQVVAALQQTLPSRHVVLISGVPLICDNCQQVEVQPPPERTCPIDMPTNDAQTRQLRTDPRCNHHFTNYHALPAVQVDDGGAALALAGLPGTAAVAALRAGKAVVFDPWLVKDGITTLRIIDGENERLAKVPAVVVTDGTAYASVVLPPRLANRLGITVKPSAVYVDNLTMPTEQEEQAALGALAEIGIDYIQVERGYVDHYTVGLLALLIAAAVITLGSAGIATALSNVDGRQDLTTLAAVGASPGVRRVLSMSRAGVIAVLGTALGTVVGFVGPVGLILVLRAIAREQNVVGVATEFPLAIPWPYLAVIALVVPAIAIVVAGLFSRSRLPVERRAAT